LFKSKATIFLVGVGLCNGIMLVALFYNPLGCFLLILWKKLLMLPNGNFAYSIPMSK